MRHKIYFIKGGDVKEGLILRIKRNNKILIEYSEDGRRRLITKRINALKGLYPDELESILQKSKV